MSVRSTPSHRTAREAPQTFAREVASTIRVSGGNIDLAKFCEILASTAP